MVEATIIREVDLKFRLINRTELESLHGKLQVVGEYLTKYFPQVAITIKQCSECPTLEKPTVWGESSNALMVFDESVLQNLQFTILGEVQENETYTEFCQTVLNDSFSHFFGGQTLEALQNYNHESWFYPGSPNLKVTLKLNEQQCQLILNGQWILNHLEPIQHKIEQLESIDKALCNEKIPLTVNLPGLKVSLKQIKQLQTGDVIQLEKKVSQPLKLCCNNTPIAEAILGQNYEYKAVKII